MKLPFGWLLFVSFLLLYWLTPTGYSTFDAVSYANQIAHLYPRTGDLHWLFHPHHLLFNALGYGLWRLSQMFGYRGGPLIILERLNGVCGAAGLAVLFAIVRRVSVPKAVLVSVGLGLSFGWWVCATDGRVNMPALLLMLAAFHALVRLGEVPNVRRTVVAGVLAGLAVLFHESAGLFVLVTAAGAWQAGKQRLLLVTLAAWAFAVLIPYLCFGVFALGLHSVSAFHAWTNRYSELGWWWDFHLLKDLQMDGYALRRALFADLPISAPLWLHALNVCSLAGGIGLFIAFVISVRRSQMLCLLWLTVYAVFFTFWTPDYFVFKLYLLLPVALIIGLSPKTPPRWASVLAAVWILGYGLLNFAASLQPHLTPTSNPFYRVALEVHAHTRPGDLLVLTGAGDLAQCEVDVPYYADREVISVHSFLTHAHDNTDLAWSQAREQIDTALHQGHAVYALNEVWDSKRAWADLHRHHATVSYGQGAALLGRYERTLAWTTKRGRVWQLSPKKRVQAGFSPATAKHSPSLKEKSAHNGYQAGIASTGTNRVSKARPARFVVASRPFTGNSLNSPQCVLGHFGGGALEHQ